MDLQWDMAPYWIRQYQVRDREIFGGNNDFDGLVTHPRDYPNIEFVPVLQMEGSKFMFITFTTYFVFNRKIISNPIIKIMKT